MGVQLAEYLKVQLPNGGKVIAQTFPAAWSDKRINGMNAALKDSNIVVVDEWGADPLNFVDGTAQEVATKLTQYGDIDAVWINFSLASIGAAQAIGVLPADEQPLLVTFYANPTTVADILEGRLDAAVDEKLEWQSWAQVDAYAQLLARGQVPSQDRAPNYNGVNFSARQVVTIDNAPTDGSEIPSPVDYEAFFRAKWCADFTNLPSC
jgi:ABC-type sugar transport system substrate-binding protein